MMKYIKYTLMLLTAVFLGACSKSAFVPIGTKGGITQKEFGKNPKSLGLIKVTISGIGTANMTASAHPVVPRMVAPGAASNFTLPGGSGATHHTIQMKPVSNGSFTYGKRPPAGNGVRYIYAVFKVRNADSSGSAYSKALHNLTLLAVNTSSGPLKTYGNTAITKLSLFDGSTPSNPSAVADSIIPTGKVELNAAGKIASSYPDVLQVFKESEVQNITLPSGSPITDADIFPWGFVVRNPDSTHSRTLPVATSSDDYDGIVTLAFKLPLKKQANLDPFEITMVFLAVDDGTTRVTRSIQEALYGGEQAFEQRAMDLNASMVTLLGHTDYFGSISPRTICGTRVAGPKGLPTTTLKGCATSAPTDIALNKTIADESSDCSCGRATNAIDGNVSTYWQVLSGDRSDGKIWITIDLGSSMSFDKVVTIWHRHADQVAGYKIQYSDDNAAWQTAYQTSGLSKPKKATFKATFTKVQGRYVKITYMLDGTYSDHINEIKIYNQ